MHLEKTINELLEENQQLAEDNADLKNKLEEQMFYNDKLALPVKSQAVPVSRTQDKATETTECLMKEAATSVSMTASPKKSSDLYEELQNQVSLLEREKLSMLAELDSKGVEC